MIAEELGAMRSATNFSTRFLIYNIICLFVYTGKLCNNVGGSAHVHKLLPPLELLICGEDNNVRSMVSEFKEDEQ